MNMMQVFRVGDEVSGYCCGVFGRDSYDDKVCVFVSLNYAVFQNKDGHGYILNYYDDIASDVTNKVFTDKLGE